MRNLHSTAPLSTCSDTHLACAVAARLEKKLKQEHERHLATLAMAEQEKAAQSETVKQGIERRRAESERQRKANQEKREREAEKAVRTRFPRTRNRMHSNLDPSLPHTKASPDPPTEYAWRSDQHEGHSNVITPSRTSPSIPHTTWPGVPPPGARLPVTKHGPACCCCFPICNACINTYHLWMQKRLREAKQVALRAHKKGLDAEDAQRVTLHLRLHYLKILVKGGGQSRGRGVDDDVLLFHFL